MLQALCLDVQLGYSGVMYLWILDGHTPVPTDDVTAWGRMMEDPGRVVGVDNVGPEARVSTVFLGIDMGHRMGDPPLLFETMVFRPGDSEVVDRYVTWDEAARGHVQTIKRVYNEMAKASAEDGG